VAGPGLLPGAVAVVRRTAAQQPLMRESPIQTRRSTHRPHALVHLMQRLPDVPALHALRLRTAAAVVVMPVAVVDMPVAAVAVMPAAAVVVTGS